MSDKPADEPSGSSAIHPRWGRHYHGGDVRERSSVGCKHLRNRSNSTALRYASFTPVFFLCSSFAFQEMSSKRLFVPPGLCVTIICSSVFLVRTTVYWRTTLALSQWVSPNWVTKRPSRSGFPKGRRLVKLPQPQNTRLGVLDGLR